MSIINVPGACKNQCANFTQLTTLPRKALKNALK